jgi:S-DNA-T family DNA segregation ATPase FtsK/SpoIIIE
VRIFVYFLFFVFWIYYFFSIVFRNQDLMGAFGKFLGDITYRVFGVLGYVFAFFLLYVLYLFFMRKFSIEVARKILGGIVIFIGFWLIEGLFRSGFLNTKFALFLKFYIGAFGVILVSSLIILAGIVIFIGERGVERILNLPLFKKVQSPKIQSTPKKTKVSKKKPKIEFDFETFIFSSFNKVKKFFSNFEINKVKPSFEDKPDDIDVIDEVKSKIDKVSLTDIDDNFDDIREKVDNKKRVSDILKEPVVSEKLYEIKEIKEVEENEVEKEVKKSNRVEVVDKKPQQEIKILKSDSYEVSENFLSQIEVGKREAPKDWVFPSINFLQKPKNVEYRIDEEEIDWQIRAILEKFKSLNIKGDIIRYYVGPVVTTFEFKPDPRIKISKIVSLQDDLAMVLKAKSVRIQAPIPGKDVVGIEVPNKKAQTIYLREIIESDIFQKSKSPLTIALGKDIVGKPFVADLVTLPHLLIGGTTGSGKSVGLNSIIISLLYRNSPDDLKLLMIDPKMLEFNIYEDIPHLLVPVVTDMKKAESALERMVKEMDRRYELISKKRVRNIQKYNEIVPPEERLPYIVVVIDELAELLAIEQKSSIETSIARLAQKARASGIHLIVATQRPSADVLTGVIRSNLPTRISFRVGQRMDSRIILDADGAEKLLGRGDMLFKSPTGEILRLHAPFVSEEEIMSVVEFLKSQREVEYDEEFVNFLESQKEEVELDKVDELFEKAKEIILTERKTSISYIQRRLQIGYNRAANIIEQMERAGILSPPNSKGKREILI